jgi:hypothetical protein
MAFDEQPDPLSDCMEAFDKMKRRAEKAEAALASSDAAWRDRVEELKRELADATLSRITK